MQMYLLILPIGSFDLNVTGGMGTYEFTLNGTTNSTGLFENLPAGTYPVQISDEIDCSTVFNVEITQPAELAASVDASNAVDCNGNTSGSLQLSANGGTGTLTFVNRCIA